MGSVFSNYVGLLESGAEEPSSEQFRELIENLRRALVHELRRRSLWNTSPKYLGITWGRHWTEDDLLDDLVHDCYQFIFIQRLSGLMRQLQVRRNIDGLIFLNIRNFLHDTQRRHDPLGYRLFEVLHGAVRSLLEDGTLHVVAGEASVRNSTTLGFSPWPPDREYQPPSEARKALFAEVRTWTGQLMPELITARKKDPVCARLAEQITRLAGHGPATFSFHELIDCLKEAVRAHWQAVGTAEDDPAIEDDGGDGIQLVQQVQPNRSFEERENFNALLECVEKRIDSLEERRKTLEYLARLWLFVRSWATEADPEGIDPSPDLLESAKFPGHQPLGHLLDIPRARIPGLLTNLRGLIEDCYRALWGYSPVSESGGGAITDSGAHASSNNASSIPTSSPPRTMSSTRENRHEDLFRQTLETAQLFRRVGSTGSFKPQDGEICLLPSTRRWPVAWLMLGSHPDGSLDLVPVDTFPTSGSLDLPVPGTADVLRLGLARRVPADTLAEALGTGQRLDREILAWTQTRLNEIASGTPEPSLRLETADQDPLYRDWIAEVERAAQVLQPDRPANVLPFTRPEPDTETESTATTEHPNGPASYLPLAAMLFFAVVGLGLYGWMQHQTIERLANETRTVQITRGKMGLERTENKIEIPWAQGDVVLMLHTLELPQDDFEAYRFEVVRGYRDPAEDDIRTEVIWDSGLRDPTSQVDVLLPHLRMAAIADEGFWFVRAYGIRDQEETVIRERRLVVVEPNPENPFL